VTKAEIEVQEGLNIMSWEAVDARKLRILAEFEALLARSNQRLPSTNGVFCRYRDPVLTREHVPLHWRFDFSETSNPRFLERLGVNAVFNPGAIFHDGKYLLVARVEGADRKSFFGMAECETGVDGFRFWDQPLDIPDGTPPDTNIYDMRLTHHEDGWIYGLFCTERKDFSLPHDLTAAVAGCGIVRTKDFQKWERLPDLDAGPGQQRNVTLHPEFVDGQYLLYTRPQDGFVDVGGGGGIGWALVEDISRARIAKQEIVDPRAYHTIKEVKNGQGPPPLKTPHGWLHLAHGVRDTAAGLRYVLYVLMTDLKEPWRVIAAPGGYLIAPQAGERVGDVSNVAFCNGWTHDPETGRVLIYYASSDTRVHVAETRLDELCDYALNTPPDSVSSRGAFEQRQALIAGNA
jgi:4-O-beta-D-mannosyl-D-glucose phosphorylase